MTKVLIVGMGLIGASLGLALTAKGVSVTGTDVNKSYEALAKERGALSSIWTDVERNLAPIAPYPFDVVFLAVPIQVACAWLPKALTLGEIVVDVCSVKKPLCDAIRALPISDQQRIAPTHPMAGKAAPGPSEATADLFVGQPWLYLRGFAANTYVIPLLKSLGARLIEIENEEIHDTAMAVVSHGIHVASLSAMLAYASVKDSLEASSDFQLDQVTGPAFRDITRLAASPSEFWVETLLANQAEVTEHLQRMIHQIESFCESLVAGDADRLRVLLDTARTEREKWALGNLLTTLS